MAILDLKYSGSSALTTPTQEVKSITPQIERLCLDMAETMYKRGGCGLAAPQVDANVSICVIDCDYDTTKTKKPFFLINPIIVEQSAEKRTTSEGCLSFPGATVNIERPSRVVVEAQNLDGDTMRYTAEDSLFAVCLQHEIDHLNGIVMLDYVGPIVRASALNKVRAKLKKAEQQQVNPWDLE